MSSLLSFLIDTIIIRIVPHERKLGTKHLGPA